MAGDFNGHIVNPTSDFDQQFHNFHSQLLNWGFSSTPTNNTPTYVTRTVQTTIDYIFLSDLVLLSSDIRPNIFSPHHIISVDCDWPNLDDRMETWQERRPQMLYTPAIRSLLNSVLPEDFSNLEAFYSEWRPQQGFTLITNLISKLACPTRKPDSAHEGWLRWVSNEAANHFKLMETNFGNVSKDIQDCLFLCEKCRNRLFEAKRALRAASKEVNQLVLKKLEDEAKISINDRKFCWKVLKKLRSPAKSVSVVPSRLVEFYKSILL